MFCIPYCNFTRVALITRKTTIKIENLKVGEWGRKKATKRRQNCLTAVNIIKEMSRPGFEGGLLRPLRNVITTRRSGPIVKANIN